MKIFKYIKESFDELGTAINTIHKCKSVTLKEIENKLNKQVEKIKASMKGNKL